MSHTRSGRSDGRAYSAALRAAEGLAFAASPTFAIIALTRVLGGDPAEMLDSAAHASPLNEMVTMYLLMSAFHAAPWRKRIRAGQAVPRRALEMAALGTPATVPDDRRMTVTGDEPVSDGASLAGPGGAPPIKPSQHQNTRRPRA